MHALVRTAPISGGIETRMLKSLRRPVFHICAFLFVEVGHALAYSTGRLRAVWHKSLSGSFAQLGADMKAHRTVQKEIQLRLKASTTLACTLKVCNELGGSSEWHHIESL